MREEQRPVIRIAPSILASDFSALGQECRAMEQAGADMLHVDVMDGHFVPNLTLGPGVVRCIRPHVRLPLDVHLMLTSPERYAAAFVQAGADTVTYHVEAETDAAALLRDLHALGVRAGLVLRPATPAEVVFPLLAEADVVMVMTVEPGFGGQKFMPAMLPKIAAIRAEAQRIGRPALDIEVDGGIDLSTVEDVVRAGANLLVAGSALFGAGDYAAAVRSLRERAQAALS